MQKNRKKTIYRVLVIIPSVLLLAAGIAILGYYTFFPAKIKLMIAGYNSTVKLFKCIDKNMDFLKARHFSPVFENTIQEKSRIGVSANEELLSVFLVPEEASEVLPHINRLALKYENQLDIRNRKLSSKWGLNYLMNPVLTARLSIDGNRYNLGVDELSNKTITGEMSDLGKLSYFFPDIPREYWIMVEDTDPWAFAKIIESIEIDRKAIKKIMLGYSREVIAGIDPKNMSVRKQKTEVFGKELECQEVKIRLDQEAQKDLAAKMIKKLSDDDLFYDTAIGNLRKAFEILSENRYPGGLFSPDIFDEKLIKENFKQSLSELNEEIQNESLEEITVKLYIDGFDIVKCEITTDPDIESYISYISFENRINGPSFEFGFNISYGYEGEDVSIHLKRDLDPVKDLSNMKFKMNMNVSEFLSLAHYLISVESLEEEINKNEVRYNFNASFDFDDSDMLGEGELDLSLKGTKTRNPKNQEIKKDYKGEISFDIPYISPDKQSLSFYYDNEKVYGEEIEIPEPDDILDLKTATEEDFNQLIAEVYEKIEALGRLTGAF